MKNEKKRALITGITGQDGSYLAELLLEKGYQVFGLVRRVAFEDESHRMHRISGIINDVELIPGSIESFPSLYNAVRAARPQEVYHLAAQSYVGNSLEDEFSTISTNINGTHNVLAVCRDIMPKCRFYFAGTSEMFGRTADVPQTEKTCFHPNSAYGISKVTGYELTRSYRENYNIFACSGILYNHESPRRGFEFVTRKITSHVAKIKHGLTDKLELGNLDARRDWGHAKEYMEAVWQMLQEKNPQDYVICTGILHSVRDFCQEAFQSVGLDYKDYVVCNPKFFRPENTILKGNAAQAKVDLGWQAKITFKNLVGEMVANDLTLVKQQARGAYSPQISG